MSQAMKQVKRRIGVLSGAGRLKVMALIGCVAVVSGIGFVVHWKSVPTSPNQPSASVEGNSSSADQADEADELADTKDLAAIPEIPLGHLLGVNHQAAPPITFHVGPRPGQPDTPDLSTPAVAVQTVLSLIDQGAADKLSLCFHEEPNDVPAISTLYPGYIGQPIALVEVLEDGDFADVIWEATVHTAFSRYGRHWSLDEVITLSARLIREDGLWKILQLHKGEKDGDPQDNARRN